jgi:hypothetical protein
VPCPHFSNQSGECLLRDDQEEDDDLREVSVEDPVDREWCLSSEKGYRQCPVYRRFLAELIP